MNGTAAVWLHGLARRFGHRWVLRGIDLEVRAGEIIGITGRNGSGKTTLLRVCAGLLRATRGGGSIFGIDLAAHAGRLRGRVGLLAHEAGVYANLTAAENLAFSLRMAGEAANHDRIEAVLARVGLHVEKNDRTRGFSAGMKRRLALARLLLRPPGLLLLDEPYASFDADGIALVNEFATDLASGGGAVLIATHDLTRGRSVIQRRIEIREGRLVTEAPEHLDDATVGSVPRSGL